MQILSASSESIPQDEASQDRRQDGYIYSLCLISKEAAKAINLLSQTTQICASFVFGVSASSSVVSEASLDSIHT